MKRLLLATVLALAAGARARAVVLGGGLADTDCTVGFDGVTATDGSSEVVCTDGDPACDADGAADGMCTFFVRACTRLPSSECTPRDVTAVTVEGLALSPPPLDGSGSQCTPDDTVALPVGAAAGATMIARDGSAVNDVDYLALCCQAAPSRFGAAQCALALGPDIAPCRGAVPPSFTAKLAKARALVARAANDPRGAPAATRRAARLLGRLRTRARALAKSDPCGWALALWMTEAQARLQAARS